MESIQYVMLVHLPVELAQVLQIAPAASQECFITNKLVSHHVHKECLIIKLLEYVRVVCLRAKPALLRIPATPVKHLTLCLHKILAAYFHAPKHTILSIQNAGTVTLPVLHATLQIIVCHARASF